MDRYIAINKKDIKKFGSTYRFLNTINSGSTIYIYQMTKTAELNEYINWKRFKNDYIAFWVKSDLGYKKVLEQEKVQDTLFIQSFKE